MQVQPSTVMFNLRLSGQAIDVIMTMLGEGPAKATRNTMNEIESQIMVQLAPQGNLPPPDGNEAGPGSRSEVTDAGEKPRS